MTQASLREQFDQALTDIVRSETVPEYEAAVARAETIAEELRKQDAAEGG